MPQLFLFQLQSRPEGLHRRLHFHQQEPDAGLAEQKPTFAQAELREECEAEVDQVVLHVIKVYVVRPNVEE